MNNSQRIALRSAVGGLLSALDAIHADTKLYIDTNWLYDNMLTADGALLLQRTAIIIEHAYTQVPRGSYDPGYVRRNTYELSQELGRVA